MERKFVGTGEQTKADTRDQLTGMMTREAFLDRLDGLFAQEPELQGGVIVFDVQRFKLLNAMFGMAEGDRLLREIGEYLRVAARPDDITCRFSGDRFGAFLRGDRNALAQTVEALMAEISSIDIPFEILTNIGIFAIEGTVPAASFAVDGAIIAQKKIKGSYTDKYLFYSEELRRSLLGEHEIIDSMRGALEKQQFIVYYQPQYNHSTGMLVGAEALVRWNHPRKGLIPPAQFIPVFENSGFISNLDLYVFEKVCAFLSRLIRQQSRLVPVSVNLARADLFSAGFLQKLEDIRTRYDVPPKFLRIEIMESSALGNIHFINDVLRTLHGFGYTVEMDDFGSGYSSLNVLKDIDFDLVKLDTRFFQDEKGQLGRGGTILSSVVRMLNWLQLPMIAEGVERVQQADYLQSIGCDCIQGYLYAKPMPEAEFETVLKGSQIGSFAPGMELSDGMNVEGFWTSESMETLIFSNFVGGAAIFEYDAKTGKSEILRVNGKYLRELGMNLTERELIGHDVFEWLEEGGRQAYRAMLTRAIETGEEQESEGWRHVASPCCGAERMFIRATVRRLGQSRDKTVFYAMIRNATAERQHYDDILDSERRFKAASEQVNIYYWEYTVATREMRPCFRCMRDLGLPALLTNYPDSAIEMGIFPPEVADMYRDWHRQIAAGVPSLEAVIPLTVGRVPFHVRYTTEFDEYGHPVKAYGSAALVVDNEH